MKQEKLFLLIVLAFYCYSPLKAQDEIENYQIGRGSQAIFQAMQENFSSLRKNKILKEDMEAFERHLEKNIGEDFFVRCHVIDSNITYKIVVDGRNSDYDHKRFNDFKGFLKSTLEHHPVKGNLDFFLQFGTDNPTLDWWGKNVNKLLELLDKVPLLLYDRSDLNPVRQKTITIPDPYIYDPWYESTRNEILKKRKKIPYESRTGIIKWRGAPTGKPVNFEDLNKSPRLCLVNLSIHHPDKIDAKLTSYDHFKYWQTADKFKEYFQTQCGDPVSSLPEHVLYLQNKYYISIDGWIAAWGRVPHILNSGSVLLLQHRHSQFFYPGMKPWVHYVPLKEDISDLLEKYDWLQKNPDSARKIAQNGQIFADECLSPAAMRGFFGAVLQELSLHYLYDVKDNL